MHPSVSADMRRLFGLLGLVLLLAGADEGTDAGRRGNALYEEGDYAAAEAAYRRGLSALSDTTGASYAALTHNLGAALHRQDEYAAARRAFLRAARAAPTDAERAQALYNAGHAAAGGGDTQAALRDFRRTLQLQPNHDDARFNYEYLKRRQNQQASSRPPSGPDIEPSAYAQKLKRQADALVAEQRYRAAFRLMTDGLQQDSTVAAYRDFMTRVQNVATIDQDNAPGSQQ
jgi:tetratricopeptide (TPR) repeat protein